MGRREKIQSTIEQLPSGATTDQDALGALKTEIGEEYLNAAKDLEETLEQLPSGTTTDQDAPGALKSQPSGENSNETKKVEEEADTSQAPEPEKNFETQRESIEDLDPGEIQPFQAIPDYMEPGCSLYPIVVKTPTSITCIEGWSLIQQAKEAGKSSLTCHIHHVADSSQEELAIRKVAIRVSPQGGIDTYAERVRNVSKTCHMLESAKDLVALSHGGRRKGLTFTSNRKENVRIVVGQRLGKSPATIGKCLNHSEFISNETMQRLVEGKADKAFFEAVQKIKSPLIINLKLRPRGALGDEIVRRISEEILRVHQIPEEIRTQEIKNLLASLAPAHPPQDTSVVGPVESEPVPSTAWGEEREVTPAREEAVQAEEEEVWEINPDPEVEPLPPFLQDNPQEDQTFDDEEIRNRGIAICEELKRYFANREIPLPETKQMIRPLIGDLNQILAAIPEA